MTQSQGSDSHDAIRRFWNYWNTTYLEHGRLSAASTRRGQEVLKIISGLNIASPDILEVGCGNGWLAAKLAELGRVTAIDIADEVIARARQVYPNVCFLAGDVTQTDFDGRQFDLVVNLETIGNVPDQQKFADSLTRVVKPGGYLILTAQNKFVFNRFEDVLPVQPGQIRNWIDRRKCRDFFRKDFRIFYVHTIEPTGHLGVLRYTNSYKLDAVARRLGALESLNRIRERIGLGQSIVLFARRK